jgi:hypothetical protein
MNHPVWAGIIPLKLQQQIPQQVPEQENKDLPGKSMNNKFEC